MVSQEVFTTTVSALRQEIANFGRDLLELRGRIDVGITNRIAGIEELATTSRAELADYVVQHKLVHDQLGIKFDGLQASFTKLSSLVEETRQRLAVTSPVPGDGHSGGAKPRTLCDTRAFIYIYRHLRGSSSHNGRNYF